MARCQTLPLVFFHAEVDERLSNCFLTLTFHVVVKPRRCRVAHILLLFPRAYLSCSGHSKSDLQDKVEDGDSQEESKETDKLLVNGREDEVSQQSEQHQNGDCDDDDDDDNARKMRQKKFWIPAVLICSDIIAALASVSL